MKYSFKIYKKNIKHSSSKKILNILNQTINFVMDKKMFDLKNLKMESLNDLLKTQTLMPATKISVSSDSRLIVMSVSQNKQFVDERTYHSEY